MSTISIVSGLTTSTTDYIWYGEEFQAYNLTLSVSGVGPFSYDVVSSQNNSTNSIYSAPLTIYMEVIP